MIKLHKIEKGYYEVWADTSLAPEGGRPVVHAYLGRVYAVAFYNLTFWRAMTVRGRLSPWDAEFPTRKAAVAWLVAHVEDRRDDSYQ